MEKDTAIWSNKPTKQCSLIELHWSVSLQSASILSRKSCLWVNRGFKLEHLSLVSHWLGIFGCRFIYADLSTFCGLWTISMSFDGWGKFISTSLHFCLLRSSIEKCFSKKYSCRYTLKNHLHQSPVPQTTAVHK